MVSRPLADICEAIVDCPHSTPVWTDAGVVVLRSQNIRNGRLDLTSRSFTDEAHYLDRTKRATPKAGDLVITREAPMGEVCMIPSDLRCCLGQRMVLLRPAPGKVDAKYLLYALLSPLVQSEIRISEGTGSTVSNLRIPLLEALSIPAPDIAQQRGISQILSAFDDKIELNRGMSETLEAMTRALFRSWFVDFDPVRAKMEGRDLGLSSEVGDLIPASFDNSELGATPSGWPLVRLRECVDAVNGRSYRSDELCESEVALVTLKSFERGGGYTPRGLKSFAGTYKPEQVVAPGEVVIACTDVTQAAEVIGRPALVRPSSEFKTLVASLDTLIIRPRDSRTSRTFLYYLCGTENFIAHTYAHTTGTTVLHLSKEAVPSFPFACPPVPLVRLFSSVAAAVSDRIEAAHRESESLAALRAALLPKLISGAIRVPDIEDAA